MPQPKNPLDRLDEQLTQVEAKQAAVEKTASEEQPLDLEDYRRRFDEALKTVGRDEMLRRTMELANREAPKGGPKAS